MSRDRVQGNREQLNGQIQTQSGKLSDDDLDVIAGKQSELIGRLQERHGIEKDAAERQLDDWLRSGRF